MSYQPYASPALAAPWPTQVLVQPHRCSTVHVAIAWVVTVLSSLYMLPWAVAATRNRRNVGSVALVNALLGWTVVGWVVALVMACGSDAPLVVVQHTYAGPPPQQWTPVPPRPYVRSAPPAAPPALRTRPARPSSPVEPTMVDPLGSEPTRQLPRSPWEPDHRR